MWRTDRRLRGMERSAWRRGRGMGGRPLDAAGAAESSVGGAGVAAGRARVAIPQRLLALELEKERRDGGVLR